MPDGLVRTEMRHMPPPLVHGVARLAALAFQGWSLDELLAVAGPEPASPRSRAAWLLDRSVACALGFRPDEAAALQAEALAITRVFRVRGECAGLRLLALMAPGNLMVNAPLGFLTAATDVQLDLAYAEPDGALPSSAPDHDVAIVAVSESAPDVLRALPQRLANWPRPVLNDPRRIANLSRDWLARALDGAPGVTVAPTVAVARGALRRQPIGALLPGGAFPVLLRPLRSHAGEGLAKLDTPDDLALFLLATPGEAFYLTQFIDCRGLQGWFCKHRIAFVDREPFLCHMAASEHWMVHYLNAGMAESAAKRAAEAAAMAGFDSGFAVRHRAALAAVCDVVGLDYFSIDAGEAPDGSLLVFEADVAAIIHSMDDPALYPYKRAPMQRCYDAFAAMLRRRAGQRAVA